MAFIDETTLALKAGTGGAGVVRWRREKFKPKCGPGGGNGGQGGDVWVEAVSDLSFLSQYQFSKSFRADDGLAGDNFGKQGARGDDFTLRVPVGSIVRQQESGFVWDMDIVGKRERLLRGGRGGLGNEHFKSSTNITPIESTPGIPGETGTFAIELQMVADIGLLGLPTAGKSSLLNALTNAKSKVGSYDFTTLEPHLGVLPSGRVIADIPGLIEGASEGRGLGIKFLKHIARTRVLVHMIAANNPDILGSYVCIRKELERFDKKLIAKPEIVILSVSDEVDNPEKIAKELSKSINAPVYITSVYNDVLLKEIVKVIETKINEIEKI